MKDMSICGTICSECGVYGDLCNGCNRCEGKVFHSEKGCAVYHCCINKYYYGNCLECKEVPCDIWLKTRDPKFTDEEFEKNVKDRLEVLKMNVK